MQQMLHLHLHVTDVHADSNVSVFSKHVCLLGLQTTVLLYTPCKTAIFCYACTSFLCLSDWCYLHLCLYWIINHYVNVCSTPYTCIRIS